MWLNKNLQKSAAKQAGAFHLWSHSTNLLLWLLLLAMLPKGSHQGFMNLSPRPRHTQRRTAQEINQKINQNQQAYWIMTRALPLSGYLYSATYFTSFFITPWFVFIPIFYLHYILHFIPLITCYIFTYLLYILLSVVLTTLTESKSYLYLFTLWDSYLLLLLVLSYLW